MHMHHLLVLHTKNKNTYRGNKSSLSSLVVLISHINRHIPKGSQSLGIIVTMEKDQSQHYWPVCLDVIQRNAEHSSDLVTSSTISNWFNSYHLYYVLETTRSTAGFGLFFAFHSSGQSWAMRESWAMWCEDGDHQIYQVPSGQKISFFFIITSENNMKTVIKYVVNKHCRKIQPNRVSTPCATETSL